jgi:PncC family amidohydrolase
MDQVEDKLSLREDAAIPALEILSGEWLRRREMKLVVAESCTGGLVGHWLTEVPGSSDYYLGSITAYANEAKQHLLGVRPGTLERYGAVSAETAVEMARGVRRALSGEFPLDRLVGISVTGIAGPGGGTPEKPVGTVWIGLSAPGVERAWLHRWQGDRSENKILSARQALQILLDYLQGKVTP